MFVFLIIIGFISLFALLAVAFSVFMRWLIDNKISKIKNINPRLVIFINKANNKK